MLASMPGDYVSYMTPTSKETRRVDWKSLNFAGTVDWAVDLQIFGEEDKALPSNLPQPGEEGCIWGEDLTTNTDALCEFACTYGFARPLFASALRRARFRHFRPRR
jgi:hypothetical protein